MYHHGCKHCLKQSRYIIREEEQYDGYYCIVTSEMDCSDAQINEIYHGL